MIEADELPPEDRDRFLEGDGLIAEGYALLVKAVGRRRSVRDAVPVPGAREAAPPAQQPPLHRDAALVRAYVLAPPRRRQAALHPVVDQRGMQFDTALRQVKRLPRPCRPVLSRSSRR
jgi:hypothetical protein